MYTHGFINFEQNLLMGVFGNKKKRVDASLTNIICEIKLEKGFSFIFFYEIYKNVNGKYFFPSCISIQPFLFFMFTVLTSAYILEYLDC